MLTDAAEGCEMVDDDLSHIIPTPYEENPKKFLQDIIKEKFDSGLSDKDIIHDLSLYSDKFTEDEIEEAVYHTSQNYSRGPPNGGIIVTTNSYDADGKPTWQVIADPKKGITEFRKQSGNREERTLIFSYYPKRVEKFCDPENGSDICYTIDLISPDGEEIRFEQQGLKKITDDIINTITPRDSTKFKKVFPSLIEHIVHKRTYNFVESVKLPATGFFKRNECIEFFNLAKYSSELPDGPVDIEKLKTALSFFDDIMEFYKGSDTVKTVIFYGLQAPTGYIRKMEMLHENKLLLVYGEKHTGKSFLSKIILDIWGLLSDKSRNTTKTYSAAQFARRVCNTTLPVILDEMGEAFDTSTNNTGAKGLIEALKISTTNDVLHSITNADKSEKLDNFHAYASPFLLLNRIPPIPDELEIRFVISNFTLELKRDDEAFQEYRRLYTRKRDSLPHLGAALRDMFCDSWAEMQQILDRPSQVEIGYLLLSKIYEQHGIDKPSWLVPVEKTDDLCSMSEKELFMLFLKERLIRSLKDIPRTRESPLWTDMSWLSRILHLKVNNPFSGCIEGIGEQYIYLNSQFQSEYVKYTGRTAKNLNEYESILNEGYRGTAAKMNRKNGYKLGISIEFAAEYLTFDKGQEELTLS